MRTKILQFALIAFATFTVISCSNDDDNNNVQQPNTIIVNGKIENINTSISYGKVNDSINAIGAYLVTVQDKPSEGDKFSYYIFSAPLSKLGQRVRFADNIDDSFYLAGFFKWIYNEGDLEIETIDGYESDTESLEPSNSWIQFTKNNKLDNTYTIEFELNLKGKIVRGNYTAEFEIDNDV